MKLNQWIQMRIAESMGGLAANISGKSLKEIREIRDWCEYLLKKRGERRAP